MARRVTERVIGATAFYWGRLPTMVSVVKIHLPGRSWIGVKALAIAAQHVCENFRSGS
jgi:hypothetical protein